MDNLQLAKDISAIAVSAGVNIVIKNAVKATTPENLGIFKRIGVGIGTFAISGVVASAAIKYTDKQIDTVGKSGAVILAAWKETWAKASEEADKAEEGIVVVPESTVEENTQPAPDLRIVKDEPEKKD